MAQSHPIRQAPACANLFRGSSGKIAGAAATHSQATGRRQRRNGPAFLMFALIEIAKLKFANWNDLPLEWVGSNRKRCDMGTRTVFVPKTVSVFSRLSVDAVAICLALSIAPHLFAGEHAVAEQPVEINGKVVDADRKPIAGAIIEGYSPRDGKRPSVKADSDVEGNWRMAGARLPLLLSARSSDDKLAAVARIEPGSLETRLTLAPTASAHGKFFYGGKPAKKLGVYSSIKISTDDADSNNSIVIASERRFSVDDQGNFTIVGLVPGQKYDVGYQYGTKAPPCEIAPRKAELIEIGMLEIPETPLEELVTNWFGQIKELPMRLAQSQKFDPVQGLRPMLIVGDPSSEASRRYVKFITSDDSPMAELLRAYEVLPTPTDNTAAMEFLKSKYGLDVETLKPVTFVVLSSDDKVLATRHFSWTMATDGDLMLAELGEMASKHALPQLDAKQVLVAALDRARKENKKVLLEESSTYCGWCRILVQFFDRHPDIFEAHFVPVRVDRRRFANGEETMQPYRPSGEGGVPWCAILDADGKKLGDWDTADGNMGFPTLPKEFDHLEKILRLAAPKITNQQFAKMRADLEQEAKKYEQE